MLETGRNFKNYIHSIPNRDVLDSLCQLGGINDPELVLDAGKGFGINYSEDENNARDTLWLIDTITAPKKPYSLELALQYYPLQTEGFTAERVQEIENLRTAWLNVYRDDPLNFKRNLTETDTPGAAAYREAKKLYFNEP